MSPSADQSGRAPGVSLVISSFDGYACCWPAMLHSLRKYWPDCPYPIYLMSNVKEYADDRVRMLKVPPSGPTDWSSSMLLALRSLDTPYVLYFQEDYWLTETVDTARVADYVALMERHGLNYIRFHATPAPDADFPHDPRLGCLADGADMRASVQVSLWRRDVFLDLLRPGERGAEFELTGTDRSRRYGQTFLSVKRRGADEFALGMRYVCTAITAGKWERWALDYARREGLRIDFSTLPVKSRLQDFLTNHPVGNRIRIAIHRARLVLTDPRQASSKLRQRLSAGHAPGHSR